MSFRDRNRRAAICCSVTLFHVASLTRAQIERDDRNDCNLRLRESCDLETSPEGLAYALCE
jgi:hypothetical protein